MGRSSGKERKKVKTGTKVRPAKRSKFSSRNNDIIHAPKNGVSGNPTNYLYGKGAIDAKKHNKKQKSKRDKKDALRIKKSSNFVARKGNKRTKRIFIARFPVIGTNTKVAPWIRNKNVHGKDNKENKSDQQRKIMNGAFSINETAMKHFNSELEEFAAYVKLTPTEIQAREYLIQQIQRSCRDLFGVESSQCQVFGSFAAQPVCIFESDIDLAIWGVVEPDRIYDDIDTKQESITKRENITLNNNDDIYRSNQKKQERVTEWKALIDKASNVMEEAEKSKDKPIENLPTERTTEGENNETPIFVLDRTGDASTLELNDRGTSSRDDNDDEDDKNIGSDFCPSESDSDNADKLENFCPSKGRSSSPKTNDAPGYCSKTSNFFNNGTIICKNFSQGYFEGEVTRYDRQGKLYSIVYTDGDTEDMTYEEVNEHIKPSQEYSTTPRVTGILDDSSEDIGKEDALVEFNDVVPRRRPRGQSLVSLSSSTTCSVEANLDESEMEVSFVVEASKETARAKVGPSGATRTRVVNSLYKLTRPLRPFASNMHVRRHARVPIINMVTRFGFECDIALGGHNGADTSSYATTQLSKSKSFAIVVVFLKVLLSQQGLDKPFTGGIGSYALYVLVASHIEHHFDVGGDDNPAEILYTFFFRYGAVKHANTKIASSYRTKLSQDIIVEAGDHGSADMKSCFQITNCVNVFEACWRMLQNRLKGKFNRKFSILQYLIDAAKLQQGRSQCKTQVDNRLKQILGGRMHERSVSYNFTTKIPGLPREEKKDAPFNLEARELIRGYRQSVETFMPVEDASSKKRKKSKNNKKKRHKGSS